MTIKNKITKTIATHSGTFQADEALGVWLLKRIKFFRSSISTDDNDNNNNNNNNSSTSSKNNEQVVVVKVIRTRDPKHYEPCDAVIDVGGKYDHDTMRYDHHQRGYDIKFPFRKGSSVVVDADDDAGSNDMKKRKINDKEERCTNLSASGLVYLHHGREIIQHYYPKISEEELEIAYVSIYDEFMEALDAIDTGVECYHPSSIVDGSQPLYADSTNLSCRVAQMNPRWNEKIGSDTTTGNPNQNDDDQDAIFAKASVMCGDEFMNVMISIVESDLPARSIVAQALTERYSVDPSGRIIKFDIGGGLPWKNHLYQLERKMNLIENNTSLNVSKNTSLAITGTGPIRFVLYQDTAGMWRVQAVTVEGTNFQNRLSLPKEWRGLRDDALTKASGINIQFKVRFVHGAGFIGGADTYQGALEMAKLGLVHSDS